MCFTLLLAGSVLAGTPLTYTDQKFLAHIHHATSRLTDKKSAFLRFDKEVTLADAQQCRKLQHQVTVNSESYVELGFVQAYYGMDYAANLQRVLRPYRVWRTDNRRWVEEYSKKITPWTDVEETPLILNLLYLRRHDLRSLGTWLDLGLDGASAEVSDDSLGELWKRHQRDMLAASDGHPRRIENLTTALMFNYVIADKEPSPYTRSKRRFAATLLPLLRSKDPRISRAAQALRKRIIDNRDWSP